LPLAWAIRSVVAVLLPLSAAAAASAASIEIVAFGDSATAGYLVAREQAYPAQLQAALRAKGYSVAEIVRSLRARRIQVMVIGLGRLDLSEAARAHGALYAQWRLPRGRYRARDGAHFNAAGYAILVRRMLPLIETLIARAKGRG
jgi:acyl-CoA thioesterase-1